MNSSNPQRLDQLDRSIVSDKKAGWLSWRLVMPQPQLATFEKSRVAAVVVVALCAVFVVLAFAPPAVLLYLTLNGTLIPGTQTFYLAIAFAAFLMITDAAFLSLIYLKTVRPAIRARPFVFDKLQRRFWREGQSDPVLGDYGLIPDIEALQVCSQRVSYSDSSWTVYELNAVMKRPPMARINISASTKRDVLLEDARRLAEFLNLPLLDHTDKEAGTMPPLLARAAGWLRGKTDSR